MRVGVSTDAGAHYGPVVTAQHRDMLEPMLLMRETGLLTPGTPPRAHLMVVPLFETIADLKAAPEIMRAPRTPWQDQRVRPI